MFDSVYRSLTLLSLIIFKSLLFSQSSIEKKDYVKYDIAELEGNYQINYTFKDHFNNFQTYTLSIPKEYSEQQINKFGVPLWLFEPYADTDLNKYLREKEINKGLFRLNNNVIEVDKSAVLDYYSETFAKPIAEMIVSSLSDYGVDNKRNRIEFAMRFIQDIPYGIPEYNDKSIHYGGVNIPPKLLINGFGDCDSKALLFVGILIYLVPKEDIIFLNQKDHVLAAIKENPSKGLTYVKYKGKHYLIAETAGPGKRRLGEKGSYYKDKFSIETLNINPTEVIPISKNQSDIQLPSLLSQQIEDNTLLLRNESSRTFNFQMSPDNRKWDRLNLNPNQAGKYIFDQKVQVFIRFIEKNNKYSTYQVDSGKVYTIIWNSRRKRWEISV